MAVPVAMGSQPPGEKPPRGRLAFRCRPREQLPFPGGGESLAALSPRVAEGGTAGPGGTSRGPAHPGPLPPQALPAPSSGRQPRAAGRGRWGQPGAGPLPGRQPLSQGEGDSSPRSRRVPGPAGLPRSAGRRQLPSGKPAPCQRLVAPASRIPCRELGKPPRAHPPAAELAPGGGFKAGAGWWGGGRRCPPLCPPGATSPAGAGGLGRRCEGNGGPPWRAAAA